MKIRFGACLLIASLPLSACSGADEPTVLPPIASSAAPTIAPTPAATASAPPVEAFAETAEGASSFARHYLKVLNVAFVSGDASAVRAVSQSDCEGCANLIAALEQKPKENRVIGGEYQVVAIASPPVINGDVIVDVTYTRAAAQVIGPAGQVVTSLPPTPRIDAQMRLLRRDSSWTVAGFRLVQA